MEQDERDERERRATRERSPIVRCGRDRTEDGPALPLAKSKNALNVPTTEPRCSSGMSRNASNRKAGYPNAEPIAMATVPT
jgi:hypothetical protein